MATDDVEADESEEAGPPSLVLSYLRLLRAPMCCTALADVLLGWLFVSPGFTPPAPLALLLGASACLYLAGMVLNDVFDISVDREERPERPLPSGQIPLGVARALGFGLLAAGVVLGALAGHVFPEAEKAALPWRSGIVALAIAACVLAYDGGMKSTIIGPVFMGLCRVGNVLLGMSAAQLLPGHEVWQLGGYAAPHFLVACGVGLYIAGVTWFARSEAGRSQRLVLAAALVVMLIALAVAASGVQLVSPGMGVVFDIQKTDIWRFSALMVLLAGYIGFRCVTAIMEPQPPQVQAAVKLCLQSLIFIDAALCAGVREPVYAIVIALLILPMQLLGRWVYST